MDDRLVPLPVVSVMLSTPEQDLLRWVDGGVFPPPTHMPDGRMCWWISTIKKWTLRRKKTPRPTVEKDAGGTPMGLGQDADGTKAKKYILRPTAWRILRYLIAENDWKSGQEITYAINPEASYKQGNYRDAFAALVFHKLIESRNPGGYKVTEKGRGWDGVERPYPV